MPRFALRGAFALALLSAACSDGVAPERAISSSTETASIVRSDHPIRIATPAIATCGLSPDGYVLCWGYNADGRAPLFVIPASGIFTQITGGFNFGCARNSGGGVQCWGSNASGQAPSTKTAMAGSFVEVSAGESHACALRDDGVVECWGGNHEDQAPATREATEGSFIAVDAGANYTCALRDDGVVECWGFNNVDQAPATRAATTGRFVQIAMGFFNSCGLRDDGAIECWGFGNDGEAPELWEAESGTFIFVAAGNGTLCAVRSDYVVNCRGANGSGQSPAMVTAPSGFSQVALSATGVSAHGCGMRRDGFVTCWGSDSNGQSVPSEPSYLDFAIAPASPGYKLTWAFPGGFIPWFDLRKAQAQDDGTGWGAWEVRRLAAGNTLQTDTDVQAGKRYRYSIRACFFGGCTPWSNPLFTAAGATPDAPTSPGAKAVGIGQVQLAWNDASSTETAFSIGRREWNEANSKWGSLTQLGNAPTNAVSYTDLTATPGARYRYYIRACNPMGCSVNVATHAVVADVAPAAPSAVVRSIEAAKVTVSWTDNSTNETRFELAWRVRNGGVWEPWQSLETLGANTTSGSPVALVSGNAYRFRVRACNPTGCSDWTRAAQFTSN